MQDGLFHKPIGHISHVPQKTSLAMQLNYWDFKFKICKIHRKNLQTKAFSVALSVAWTISVPSSGDESTNWLLQTASKYHRRRWGEKATIGVDAAEEISMDATVAEVLSELGGIFTLKKNNQLNFSRWKRCFCFSLDRLIVDHHDTWRTLSCSYLAQFSA